jgi:hypothetical protein
MKKRKITVNIDSTLKYLQLWNGIFNLTNKEAEILSQFIDVNEILNSENICAVENKKQVAALAGVKDYNTLNNYIKKFKDKKVMFKQPNGNYTVNPFLDINTTNVEVVINRNAYK